MFKNINKRTLGYCRRLVVVLAAFTFLFSLSSASAQTESEIEAENEQLEAQRNEIADREGIVQGQIGAGQQDLAELTTQLDELELSVNQISSQVSSEQAKLEAAEREVQNIQDESEAKEAEISELQDQISDQAIVGYQIGDIAESGPSDPTEQLRMQSLLDSVTSTQVEDIERLNDLVTSLEEERAFAEILEKRIEATKLSLEEDRAELAVARDQQQVLVDQADAVVESRLAEAAVLQERDADLAAQITANTEELAARAARKASSGPTTSFNSPTAGEIVRVQGIDVHVSIAGNFERLMNAARADGINLGGWGYRDSQRQIELRIKHCGSSDYAIYQMSSSSCSPPTARPGASQHERGLAIDFTLNGGSIGSRYNAGYKWLAANAATYGLYNLPSEPWHWSTTGN